MNNVKNEKLAVRCRKAKKFTAVTTMALITMAMASCFAMSAFAADVSVSTSSFISTACKVLKALIILIGGGIGVWGLVNLVEGYGSDNPGSKSQGMKQLMAGIALIILAIALVPELEGMMSSAVQ
jgi:hypothetical protein